MSWDRYERAAERGPMSLFATIFLPIITVVVVLGVTGYFLGWFGEGMQVAREEFGPRAMLKKYEWFISQANGIEKMDRDIALFQNRVTAIEKQFESYGDKSKWSPDVRIQYNMAVEAARTDSLAVTSQRNGLVQEYNAASEKFNWSPFQTRPDKPKERFHVYVVN